MKNLFLAFFLQWKDVLGMHFFLKLILQSSCFVCITWKHKQTMEQELHRACKWTKSNNNNKKLHHIQIEHMF